MPSARWKEPNGVSPGCAHGFSKMKKNMMLACSTGSNSLHRSSRTGIFDIVLEDRIENIEKGKMPKLSVHFFFLILEDDNL